MKHTKCYVKDYPRPQFVRKSWIDLNGKWDFKFDRTNEGESKRWFEGFTKDCDITVPFSYHTDASGIAKQERCDNIWYQRKFKAVLKAGQSLKLNFEGCDYIAKVWLNGTYLGSHEGGYTRFSLDAGAAAKDGENVLVVKAEDWFSDRIPRGKQRWRKESYGCWYVETNGIWKSVWAETVNPTCLKSVRVRTFAASGSASFEGYVENYCESLSVRTVVSFGDDVVYDGEQKLTEDCFRFSANVAFSRDEAFRARLWSINCPQLYDVEYILKRGGEEIDRVGSYFGFVEYSANRNRLLINDSEYYMKMLLDQGYWKESQLTPPSEEAIEKDVADTVKAGFNGIRKHQKIEDERFYYYCDIAGVVAWCEMPSLYDFSEESKRAFFEQWTAAVRQNINHPCIMAWVPFNESWGVPWVHHDKEQQEFTKAAYYLTKSLDPTRLVVSNDGWDHTVSDVVTVHHYAERGEELTALMGDIGKWLSGELAINPQYRRTFAEGYAYAGQPVIISEYGGIAFDKDKGAGWGYGNFVHDEKAYLERLNSLTSAIRNIDGVCGYCLTQTTDVQQEVNGILTEAREWKADPNSIRQINEGRYRSEK